MDPRRATPADTAEIVRLRRLMFDSMGVSSEGDWEPHAARVIAAKLADDSLVGFVVDAPGGSGRLASAGLVELRQGLPSPADPLGRTGYISSMSTDDPWRRRGHARCILRSLIDEALARDVTRIELHAAPDGLPLYLDEGFVARPGGAPMRWVPGTRG